MFSLVNLSSALRWLAGALQTPVIICLLALAGLTVIMFGTLLAEFFTERRRLKAKLPELADKLREGRVPLPEIIAGSELLRRQRNALLEITRHPELTPAMRESLAARLVFEEREHYGRIVRVTEMIVRLGPMLGLLGTLIPLGPGIIALGRGDTYTLSVSLMTAFDTTIAGLAAAAGAFVLTAVRRSWYGNYMSVLEMCMECALEQLNRPEGEQAADEAEKI